MSKFYFQVYDGDDRFDIDGIDCDDNRGAYLQMLNIAVQEVSHSDEKPMDSWSIEVQDARGNIIGSMGLGLYFGRLR